MRPTPVAARGEAYSNPTSEWLVLRPDAPNDFRAELDLLLPTRLRKWNQTAINNKVMSSDERRSSLAGNTAALVSLR